MIVTVAGQRSATVVALLSAVLGTTGGHSVREWEVGQQPDGDVAVALDSADPRAVAALFAAAAAVVVPADDAALVAIAAASSATVRTVGLTRSADVQATAVDARATGTALTVTTASGSFDVSTALLGEHQVVLVLAALAAAEIVGLGTAASAARLASVTGTERWVMQAGRGPSGALVINDAAEATSQSTAASLKNLALFTASGGRSIAVLGSVDSTPADALDDHDRLGRLIVRLNVALLIVVGHDARHIHVAAGLEGSWDGESVLVDTAEEAYDLLSGILGDGDVVLVKSSATAGLGPLGDRLGGIGA